MEKRSVDLGLSGFGILVAILTVWLGILFGTWCIRDAIDRNTAAIKASCECEAAPAEKEE